jgi:hypothetical protein
MIMPIWPPNEISRRLKLFDFCSQMRTFLREMIHAAGSAAHGNPMALFRFRWFDEL